MLPTLKAGRLAWSLKRKALQPGSEVSIREEVRGSQNLRARTDFGDWSDLALLLEIEAKAQNKMVCCPGCTSLAQVINSGLRLGLAQGEDSQRLLSSTASKRRCLCKTMSPQECGGPTPCSWL